MRNMFSNDQTVTLSTVQEEVKKVVAEATKQTSDAISYLRVLIENRCFNDR